jgi:hypothetical protein
MDAQRVAEDPAVLNEAGEHAELGLGRVEEPVLGGAEVGLELAVGRVDPPRVVAQVPRELDRRGARRGEVPVEQDDAIVGQPEVVVAQVAVKQRSRPGVTERLGERRRIAHGREHLRRDVVGHRVRERVPGRLELLRHQVGAVALGLGDAKRRHPEPIAERRDPVRNIACELSVHRRRDLEDAPALSTGEPAVVREEGRGEIRHQHPPSIPVRVHALDPVVEARR